MFYNGIASHINLVRVLGENEGVDPDPTRTTIGVVTESWSPTAPVGYIIKPVLKADP